MKQAQYDGWVSVFASGIDYEADMVKDRLMNSGIHAVVMTKKDRSFSLTHGSLARIYVLVSEADESVAQNLLASEMFTAEELTAAALSSDPEHVPAPNSDQDISDEAK
ncbi:MAG: hypothetical protein O3B41_00870 [Bacteroidetes bacterium]|nr:hypothetical protein [Bacteroidota bacterium]